MGWGSIFRRRARVFAVALLIYLDYKGVQKRGKWMSKEKRSELWQKAHERNAKRVLRLILELNGLWVKLGQYLSTRADVLPEAYISRLRQLQDSLPPRPLKEVCGTIKKELGKPVHDIFQNFIEKPLATASIAQVHQATLMNGEEVVVKVQHDGIKDVILEDLKNAKSIVNWIAWAEPQYDLSPVINEWCNEAPKELDFNREAENTRSVSDNLCHKSVNNDAGPYGRVDVLIPKVIQSTEKVLILEFMDGIRLNDLEALEAHGVDKHKIVEEITRAYAHQIYVDGFFNGDPHPGNFLVSKHPPHRPVLLDFGLTKSISSSMKVALAKMFLAAAEGDQVALLSAFAEMGLKLRVDLPEQSMEITNLIFRTTAPAAESLENMKAMANEREKNKKIVQEKLKLDNKEMKRFNPVDAFPGDAVIFFRVLNLLRGLSSMLDVRIVYLDIMRPFAEITLQGSRQAGSESHQEWICPTKALSDVESRLRQFLLELGKENILGVQVCAYKDGEVVLDTAAGVLGKYDPRPVQPDSLFPVFSVSKGITTGLMHWLVDKGKMKFEDNVASVWPSFNSNGKDNIKVHHVLNHTSGLHSAMSDITRESPLLMSDWKECLTRICASTPETEPGMQQSYHYLSFGWLCGGIIEEASGKSFQEILEEAIIHPLNLEGELYIGIPPGVESRLATLSVDDEDLKRLSGFMASNQQYLPSNFQLNNIADLVKGLPVLFNMLAIRRAIIPAANGHCSARALARYYAALVSRGEVPTLHTTNFETPLGSLPHIPKLPSLKKSKSSNKHKEIDNAKTTSDRKTDVRSQSTSGKGGGSTANGDSELVHVNHNGQDKSSVHGIFSNPEIHDAFLGIGKYEALALPDGQFGLGFRRLRSSEGELIGFGHSGIGGSTGFCNIEHNFAVALTVNKMSLGVVSRRIIQFVCSELGVPVPEEFSASGMMGPDMQLGIEPSL